MSSSSEDNSLLVEGQISYKSAARVRKWKIITLLMTVAAVALLVVVLTQNEEIETLREEQFNTPTDNNPNGLTYPNDFPTITIEQFDGASQGTHLISPYTFSYPGNFMAAVNTNGDIVQYLGEAKTPFQAIMWKPEEDIEAGAYSFSEVDELDDLNGTLIADSAIYLTDSLFNEIRRVKAVDPLETTDNHDFDFQNDGDVIIIGLDSRNLDLSSLGGPSEAGVIMSHIQILNSDDSLQFYFNGWDYFTPEDSLNPIDESSTRWELSKATSVVLLDDNTILSAWTYLNRILLINASATDPADAIIWQLGGKGVDPSAVTISTFVNDDQGGFVAPHDAQFLPNGNLLIYDNGIIDFNNPDHNSRIVEYSIDATALTLTLEWEYQDTVTSLFGGGVQKLSSGNYIMTRLSQPCVIEVNAAGDTLWTLTVEDNKMPEEDVQMFVTRAYFVPFTQAP